MPRIKRITKGNVVYHVMNRAVGKLKIFKRRQDFELFEEVLAQGVERFKMRLCAYCIMTDHWHLLLWPRKDEDLSEFMKWTTVTFSHRWQVSHDAIGQGSLYRGRYKSFPVQSGEYMLSLMRYIESHPVRTGCAKKAAEWPWSSFATRADTANKPITLSKGPVELPKQWRRMVEAPGAIKKSVVEQIELSIKRGRPLGNDKWTIKTVEAFGLESTIRPIGRPRLES
ncbi:MAG: transposase [Phycisphaerae bacterium]|nr:transposase [Phycisphaerae bacterium]